MKEFDHYEIVDIERPFYFLCGPNINDSQKRNVFSSFLKKHYEKQTIRPFPIIVDRIFDTPLIEKYKLNLVLLEEIVAATSLKTYIFLDSLSTAYELGLFKNSKTKNSIRILVESTFADRKRRKIGDYLTKSIGKESFIEYQAINSGNEEDEFFEFNNGEVSEKVVKCIEQEMEDYSKNVQSISLVCGEYDGNPNNVFIKLNKDTIKVTFSLKSLFYMMQAFLYSRISSYKQIKALDRKSFDTLFQKFKLYIKRQALINLGNRLDKVTIFNNYDIEIDQFEKSQVLEIIRHIYFFFVLLNENSGSLHRLNSTKEAFHDVRKQTPHSKYSIDDIFGFIDNKTIKMVWSYLDNPDNFVDYLSYVVNKKLRKIYKYKDNYKGRQLRFVHERMVSIMDLVLPSNPLSYAYKSGQNTLKCFSEHKKSSAFLKLDVHHYFESIKYHRFINLFLKQIYDNLKTNGIKISEYYGAKEFKTYIRALFYKGHIPLGFVSSPKVSDFYLKSVDDWALNLKMVKYSRYADDILFSTCDSNYSFIRVKSIFEDLIKEKGLSINQDKVIQKKLINNGDCIKFLGICLVKKNDENVIGISKHYLKKVIKDCYRAKEKGTLEDEHIIGKIRYIKLISDKSFDRLIKALNSNDIGKEIIHTINFALRNLGN